jgi:predicted RecB family nuclease
MYKKGDEVLVSASDLVGHLYCRHLTTIELDALAGRTARPNYSSPLLEMLRERGAHHEAAYVEHLRNLGKHIVSIPNDKIDERLIGATVYAMKSGVDVITQAAFKSGPWIGRADVLLKTNQKSSLGNWSYEAVDTKLSRETKGGTILQLCLYSEFLNEIQGVLPKQFHVIVPWSGFEPQTFRVAEFLSYHRFVKHLFLEAIAPPQSIETYPNPDPHCDVCRWSQQCDQKRRRDDHVSLVAGLSKRHIQELNGHAINSLESLATMAIPLAWKPERGNAATFVKLHEQARLQKKSKDSGQIGWEALPIEAGYGFYRMSEPSKGDVFFDLEGDPFVGEGGIEYLFGWVSKNATEQEVYEARWALSQNEEKKIFEEFIDFLMKRWTEYPEFHVYHYAPYEPSALKRLCGRYGTRAEELDKLLRGKRFIDLLAVVRQGLQIGVESYSIKRLEPLYRFTRDISLPDANVALARIQADLELGSKNLVEQADKDVVQGYNKDDCFSTLRLRDWLEDIRKSLIAKGHSIERPQLLFGDSSENTQARNAEIAEIFNSLIKDVPLEASDRSPKEHGRWILAHMLDWHNREWKVTAWERFRLDDLTDEDLVDEKQALVGLVFDAQLPFKSNRERVPTHRYKIPPQEFEFKPGLEVFIQGKKEKIGTIEAIDFKGGFVDIKKIGKAIDNHPKTIVAFEKRPSDEEFTNSLRRLAKTIVQDGFDTSDPVRTASVALLIKKRPFEYTNLQNVNEAIIDAGLRLIPDLSGVLAIQGPPGAGKTFTGAHLIANLLTSGKRVGVTANSHKVIANLLKQVSVVAGKDGLLNVCYQKVREELGTEGVIELKGDAINPYVGKPGVVVGSTAWLWAAESTAGKLDVLFVDEAAQMSLANVLAVSQAAHALVLLGDPRQLEQPTKATHPEGVGVSAMDHLLGGAKTIPEDMGLFLEASWRMHPEVCSFISENFYEGRLEATKEKDLGLQAIIGPNLSGSGLRIMPITHLGNQVQSQEEAVALAELVKSIISNGHSWIDDEGASHPIGWDDILVVAPFNAQVRLISSLLPNARVGTVDKFQGQEAPIVIYSTTTSSIEDAPRGPEFLYSPNRLNVAISRAKCMAIMVASPAIFEASCRTPRHMQLVNAYCRYRELATPIALSGSEWL